MQCKLVREKRNIREKRYINKYGKRYHRFLDLEKQDYYQMKDSKYL
jgi:hypothetical protein